MTMFTDAAPESKHRVMTNSYLRFVNFVGVGTSPWMMPWIYGGNFSEGSAAMKWLHKNVINDDIQQLGLKRIGGKQGVHHPPPFGISLNVFLIFLFSMMIINSVFTFRE